MPQEIRKTEITFPNKSKAVAVFPSSDTKAEDIVAALGLKPHRTVILSIGAADGIDKNLEPRLVQLFSRGVARAAADANAVIIDGGTQAGVMAMMGQGVADRGFKSSLIGVAPIARVTYPGSKTTADTDLDPNHSHFVLVEGNEWGAELDTIFNLAKTLTSQAQGVVILAGGGSNSRSEALQAVRQRLPLIVVEGSGGLADEIAAAWRAKPALPDDPVLAEIIVDGRIKLHLLSTPIEDLERLIIRTFDNVLLQAWEHFADYDWNAGLQQKRFDTLQISILAIGVLGTALALIKQVYGPPKNSVVDYQNFWWWLHKLLIIVPILLTVLITAVNRFKQGNKWLLLRASAEAIKREIYRYRTRSTYYKEETGQPSPDQQLSKKVEDITRRAMRTEVNTSALVPYDKAKGFPPYMYAAGGGDDGFSLLTPNHYLEVRLTDQLNYYRKTALKLERQLQRLQWLIFIIGGLGTFLAAVNQQVWIALTTALVAAFTTYLSYRQTESSLMKYNQARTDLDNVKAWWTALSAEEQARQENIDSLVDHTEQVLEAELGGWVQQMQNALAELRKEQTPATERREKDAPQKPVPPAKPEKPGEQPEAEHKP